MDRREFFGVFEHMRATLLRFAVVALGLLLTGGQLARIYVQPAALHEGGALLLLLATLGSGGVLYLARSQLRLAYLLWQLLTVTVVYILVTTSGAANWALLLIVLPLLAILAHDWLLALMGVALALAPLWLVADGSLLRAEPTAASVYVSVLLATAAVAWAAAQAGRALVRWYSHSYALALEKMEEARDQRLELKQIQQDLVDSNQQLTSMSRRLMALTAAAEEAKRAKEDFVAAVSHELRTPLNMIIGFSEVIVQSPEVYGGALPPALMADIASIRRNSAHLLELINDVLDLSQVDMGKLSITPTWADSHELVQSAVEAVRPLYESKALALETILPTAELALWCDPTRMREVLVNLLSNAGRFTEEGGVTVQIEEQGSYLRFAVSDTGPGIAPEKQAHLFEPFHQLDPTVRSQFGGSGLGLAISKRFVELHDGRMWLDSQPGAGTTIYFTLPKGPLPDELPASPLRWLNPHQPYVERTHRSTAPRATPVARILIAEDEGEILTRLLRRYLSNFEINRVANLDAALVDLHQTPAELVVVNAPDAEQQVTVYGNFAQPTFGTPIVGCWTPGLHEAADRLGVLHYLVKPVSRDKLLAALADLQPEVRTVLVADDNVEVLQLFGRILATADPPYRVLRASGGRQALDLLRQRRPDALILDLVMEDMSGYQVLRRMALDPSLRQIPVLVVSSLNPTDQHAVCDVLHVGMEGGLTASNFLTLLAAVQETLSPQRSLNS